MLQTSPPSPHSQRRSSLPAGQLAGVLAEAADALACPLLLLDGTDGLLHANLAGHALLSEASWLTQGVGGRVVAATAVAQAALQSALELARQGRRSLLTAPAPSTWGTAALTLLPFPGDWAPHPAAQMDSAPAATRDGAVLLVLPATGRGGRPDLSGYAELHGLSRAESRVLGALMQGQSPRDVATALGVSLPTVRSQIAALRRKTGTASLAELVRNVAALPPLVAVADKQSPQAW